MIIKAVSSNGRAHIGAIVGVASIALTLGCLPVQAASRRSVVTSIGVVVGWSLGETLDWRGTGTGTAFKSDAVTLRVVFNRDDGPQIAHQVLAVVTVHPGLACLRAAVDMAANASPYDIARQVVDDPAPFRCGKDRPRTVGTPTAWTARVLERSGTAPD